MSNLLSTIRSILQNPPNPQDQTLTFDTYGEQVCGLPPEQIGPAGAFEQKPTVLN